MLKLRCFIMKTVITKHNLIYLNFSSKVLLLFFSNFVNADNFCLTKNWPYAYARERENLDLDGGDGRSYANIL